MKKGLIYVFLTAVMFVTLEPVSKLIANQVDPYAVTFIRFLIGSILLMPLAIYNTKKHNIKITKKDHLLFFGLGILVVCISMVLLQMAVLKSTSPALIAIIFSSNSVMTIILAAFVLKDKITWKKILSLGLCLIGILVCSWKNLSNGLEIIPVILAIFSALTFSVNTVISKRTMSKMKGSIVTGYSFLYGSIVLLIFLLISGRQVISGISLGTLPALLYLGVFVTGIGYWSYFMALEKTNATTASLAFFIKPILAPLAAFIITGEPFTAEVFIALALVLAGSYLSNK